MIKKIFLGILFLVPLITLAQETTLSFGANTQKKESKKLIPIKYKKISKYTVQVLSTKTEAQAQKILKKLPSSLREEVYLYTSGHYIVARYKEADKQGNLTKYLADFKQYGFKDAYVIKTTKWHMLTNILPSQTNVKKTKKPKLQIKSFSKYKESNTLLKADKAYKSGNEVTAILYYEMLLNSGYASDKLKNNLSYLYGKRGAYSSEQSLLKKEKYISKLLYAYAYGALESNQENFMKDLAEDILMDNSGRLALLAASYYEKRLQMDDAFKYYRFAYEKNPSSMYIIFAYARSLDIQKKYSQAIKYYKQALQHSKRDRSIYLNIKQRVVQLEKG